MAKMIGNQLFETASHCVYRLSYHIVFCVKFRRHILTSEKRDFLFARLHAIADEIHCKIIEVNGEDDHIHFLLETPPTVRISDAVGKLKSKSASALLDKFGSFFWKKHARTVWSSGFFVSSTGGVTLETLKAYIENQGRG